MAVIIITKSPNSFRKHNTENNPKIYIFPVQKYNSGEDRFYLFLFHIFEVERFFGFCFDHLPLIHQNISDSNCWKLTSVHLYE